MTPTLFRRPFGAACIWPTALAAALNLLLGACSLGPVYHKPQITPPDRFNANQATADWPSTDWWHGFGSTQLDQLIAQAQHANDDLAAAVARVREADAQVRVSRSALLPTLGANIGASRARSQVQGGGHAETTQYEPLLAASYELDFWGRNRAGLDAAKAAAAGSRYDRTTVELGVEASVATDYFQALALRERLQVAEANLQSAQTTLQGLKLGVTAGTTGALDVAQQETAVANLRAALPPLRQALQQDLDALCILLGQPPGAVTLAPGSLATLARPPVQAGLPSELLARRPDVAYAETQLIAANANIAAARAAFFPNIALTAQGGYESSALSSLFNPASQIFSLAAGLAQPIFQGGALKGQLAYSKARYDELLADYHKAAIAAFGNVQDALIAVQESTELEQRQHEAAAQAQRAYDIAQAQLRAGTIDIFTVLNTQGALFTARDALVQAETAHLQALVGLFEALGGGWTQAAQAAKVS